MDLIRPSIKESAKARIDFLRYIFDDGTGFVCLARISKSKEYNEVFFRYPEDLEQMNNWIEKYYPNNNLYFCPQILEERKRIKQYVKSSAVVWADLDIASPDKLFPKPTLVIESSPDRYHGYWKLDEHVDPFVAEEASKRIAYQYKDIGVDQSGWDLTQLLRLPHTYNLKYEDKTPLVRIIDENDKVYDISDLLNELAPLPNEPSYSELPKDLPDLTSDQIISHYSERMNREIAELLTTEPDNDWSSTLWRLECKLFEIGLTPGEVFIVVKSAPCNKYERDGRPEHLLWREVCKAAQHVGVNPLYEDFEPLEEFIKKVRLLTDEERANVKKDYIIDEYLQWAGTVTDADERFHQVGVFVLVSSLLSGYVKIPTDYGRVNTNLWGLLLADTTIARKSTAMRLVTDIMNAVNPAVFLATDGSTEGIMSALALRPGKASLFLRDEFTGFMEKITGRTDFHAGMGEDFAKLYDGDSLRRVLRRETISIQEPVFVLFAGGLKTKLFEIINESTVTSGFLPRFVIASSKKTVFTHKSRRPYEENQKQKQELTRKFENIFQKYDLDITVKLPNGGNISRPKTVDAVPTDECWDFFDKCERKLAEFGATSPSPEIITPMLVRLSDTLLKASALLAATKANPEEQDEITISIDDMRKAAWFVEQWAVDAIEVCYNAVITSSEKMIMKAFKIIAARSAGVYKSDLMRQGKWMVKDMNAIIDTLEQRNLIIRKKVHRGEKYFAIDKM